VAHTESTEPTEATATAPADRAAAVHSAESPLHEGSNISLRALIWFVIIFLIAGIVIHLLVWWVFIGFRSAVGQERQITGVTAEHIPPPEPRLQPSVTHNALPSMDLARLQEAEHEEFARRGWVDVETGEVRIPDRIVAQIVQMSQKSAAKR
jgi:hypothetical protein